MLIDNILDLLTVQLLMNSEQRNIVKLINYLLFNYIRDYETTQSITRL